MLTPLLLSFTQLYIMNTHKRTRMSAATPNAAESQTQSESQRSRTSRNYAHSNVQSGVSVATTAHSSSASSATQPIELSSDSSDTSDSDCQDHDSDSIDDSDGSDSDSDSDSDSENHGDAPISELQRTVSPSPTAAAEVATHAVNDTCNNFGIDAAELNGRYELLSRLGRGSYGEVYKARDVRTGELVAIKRIHDIFSNQINAKRLLREIKLLRHMQHPNIIRFHGLLCPVQLPAFNTLLLVFELMDTDLSKILASNQTFSNLHIQYFSYQLLSACHYMHSCHIVHRDLKPANILVNSNCQLKIIDLGLARMLPAQCSNTAAVSHSQCHSNSVCATATPLQHNATAASTVSRPTPAAMPSSSSSNSSAPVFSAANSAPAGCSSSIPMFPAQQQLNRCLTRHVVTRWYRAPEIIYGSDYSTKIDVWSAGCIIAELLTMQKSNLSLRTPLFPGHTCFPLTGGDDAMKLQDKRDQLNLICDVIGTPAPQDIKLIQDPQIAAHLRSCGRGGGSCLSHRYHWADPIALDLISQLLRFNADVRLTALQALQHEYFDAVRQGLHCMQYTGQHIHFEFENKEKLSREDIRELLWQEVLIDHPAAAAHTATAAEPQQQSGQHSGAAQQQPLTLHSAPAAVSATAAVSIAAPAVSLSTSSAVRCTSQRHKKRKVYTPTV